LLYPCTVLFNLILSSQHSDQATDWSTGVGFPAGAGTFLSSLPLWGPTQPLIQRVSGAVTLVVMRLGHGTDHSPLSSEVVKNPWSYICSAPYVIMLLCWINYRIHLQDVVLYCHVYSTLLSCHVCSTSVHSCTPSFLYCVWSIFEVKYELFATCGLT